MLPLPAVDAVDTALRFRQRQLAHHVLSHLGTVVRHGLFKGLDLGPDVLLRGQPVARLLGQAQVAWLQHALHLCHAGTSLLQFGAADGWLACGLLQARLVHQARLLPASDAAVDVIAADARRAGVAARLQCEPPGDTPESASQLASWAADQPHLLAVVDSAPTLLALLDRSGAGTWQRTTWLCPLAGSVDDVEWRALRERLGPGQLLVVDEPPPVPPELRVLDANDQALLAADAGPSRWWCVEPAGLPQRRRTLVCVQAGDQFVAMLLRAMQWDAFEPLSIDVLHYPNPKATGPATDPTFRATQYPRGVRAFELGSNTGAPGGPDFDPAQAVTNLRGFNQPARAFFDGYEQYAVWSINANNAALLPWLADTYGRERLSVLVSDDEVDRRWRAMQYLHSGNPALAEVARKHHGDEVERAFECVRHFVTPRLPWEEMLCVKRRADHVIRPWMLPIKNKVAHLMDIRPPDDAYVMMLHPKPSLPRDEVLAQLQTLQRNWQVGKPLRVLVLRNDMASGPLAMPEGSGPGELRVFPAPLPTHIYFEILAGCHGLVLVPRGGQTSTREAFRLGLDVFDDGSSFSPNLIQLRDELGLHVQPRGPITALDDGHVTRQAQRLANQRRVADYERAAVSYMRQAYL